MSFASSWVSPPTRTERIENLVSGVGEKGVTHLPETQCSNLDFRQV